MPAKITTATVHPAGTIDRHKAVVVADFDDGRKGIEVLSFYDDELRFESDEFVGLTEDEVGDLFHTKDVAYLRS